MGFDLWRRNVRCIVMFPLLQNHQILLFCLHAEVVHKQTF